MQGFQKLAADISEDDLDDVYRGAGLALPADFFIPDQRGMIAAMEFAFASTSRDPATADSFATTGGASVVFLVRRCRRDAAGCHNGVDLRWISAEPKEKEVLFPPFTLLRVMSMKRDGQLITLEVCPTWSA